MPSIAGRVIPPAFGDRFSRPQLGKFAWDNGETLALAESRCQFCKGLGVVLVGEIAPVRQPCTCVLRRIFRLCYSHFQECAGLDGFPAGVSMSGPHGSRRYSYGRKQAEFAADFCTVARRVLGPAEHRLFRRWFVYGNQIGAPVDQATRKRFYLAIRGIEIKLGRAFRELQPYCLFPIAEYYGGPSKYEQYRSAGA